MIDPSTSSKHEPDKLFEQRFDELESRLAFQDHTLEQLNTVVARQDQDILKLQQQVSELMAKLDDLGSAEMPEGEAFQHEIPPHY